MLLSLISEMYVHIFDMTQVGDVLLLIVCL